LFTHYLENVLHFDLCHAIHGITSFLKTGATVPIHS
jgi:hypothetical protein